MDIVIAVALNFAILIASRYLLFGRAGPKFWLLLFLLNGTLLFARFQIDKFMDRYGWDKANAHMSDILLTLCVFLIPAFAMAAAMFVWSELHARR